MTRIAAAMLIAVAVLALNGGMLREAFARDAQVPKPVATTTSRALGLLMVLEALRQEPVPLTPQKV
jgi:hypothetical protein